MAFNLLDIPCSNKELFETALTHPSYTKEKELSSLKNYERLEFLGDSVLKLLTSKLLYNRYPTFNEGDLSKIRSILVSDAILAEAAITVGVDKLMKLGEGEEHTGGRTRESNIACTMEAVFGAYYLDGKINLIEQFINENILPKSDDIENHFARYNAKAVLQEYTQSQTKELPEYNILDIIGPNHKPIFKIEVVYKGEQLAIGEGNSKKEAQQNAAYKACLSLGIIEE